MYLFRFIESSLRRSLWYLARAIANRKIFFAIIPIIFVMFSMTGPIVHWKYLDFAPSFSSLIPRSSNRFPSTGQVNIRSKSILTRHFNSSNPVFNALHRNSPSDFAFLIKATSSDKSVIREATFNTYLRIKKAVRNITVSYERSSLTWSQLCSEMCSEDDDVIKQILASESKITLSYPETLLGSKDSSGNFTRLFLGLSIGGVDTDMDGTIARARALKSSFFLKENIKPQVLQQWDREFRKRMTKEIRAVKIQNAEIYWWSFHEYIETVTEMLRSVYKILGISFLILLIVCILSSLGSNGYQSKPVLGLLVSMILIISCITGFAVQFAGVAYVNAFVFPAFFIITAIGLLVLFFLENAWSKYSNVACDPVEKLSLIMSWDGPGVVLSLFTIIIPFLVLGCLTSNPYLQYNAFVTAAGVAVLLIFALLFFMIFVYINGRRETKGVKWYQFFRSGDKQFAPRIINDYDECNITLLHDKLVDVRPSVSRLVASMACSSQIRCPAAFLFAIYLVFAVWGCKDLSVDLREEYFVPRDSESGKYLYNFRKYFSAFEKYLELVFDEPIDYFDQNRRNEILSLIDWPQQNQFAVRSVSWLKDFAKFESSTIYDINADTFVPILNVAFLTIENYEKYQSDITFDKFQTRITSSRMYIELTRKGVQERLSLIEELINRATALGLPLSIKTPLVFLIQHDLNAVSTVFVAFAIVTLCVGIFSFLFYGIPSLAVLFLLCNTSVLIGVIGFSVYWNVPINIISLSISIIGNGLTTGVIAYFGYNYVASGKIHRSVESRTQYSFQCCFLPVSLACFVPPLTYLPLIQLDVPIVTHVFKTLLLNSSITYAHLLLFLPSIIIFLTEKIPSLCDSMRNSCEDCCCYCFEMEEDTGSIYYIPTAGRDMRVAKPYPYAFTAQAGLLLPTGHPNYLTLTTPVIVPDILPYHTSSNVATMAVDSYRTNRSNNNYSEPSVSVPVTPRIGRSLGYTHRMEHRNKLIRQTEENPLSTDDAIYEAPPSPTPQVPVDEMVEKKRHINESKTSDERHTTRSRYNNEHPQHPQNHLNHQDRNNSERDPVIEMRSNWRQYLLNGTLHQTVNVPNPQSSLYYSTPLHKPPRYNSQERPRRY